VLGGVFGILHVGGASCMFRISPGAWRFGGFGDCNIGGVQLHV
jgi:hypothetical protein